MCGAPAQTPTLPAGVDLTRETVIYGVVATSDGAPFANAYVRLLDATGEFTAEVVSSATGEPGSQRARNCWNAPRSWTRRCSRTSRPSGRATEARV